MSTGTAADGVGGDDTPAAAGGGGGDGAAKPIATAAPVTAAVASAKMTLPAVHVRKTNPAVMPNGLKVVRLDTLTRWSATEPVNDLVARHQTLHMTHGGGTGISGAAAVAAQRAAVAAQRAAAAAAKAAAAASTTATTTTSGSAPPPAAAANDNATAASGTAASAAPTTPTADFTAAASNSATPPPVATPAPTATAAPAAAASDDIRIVEASAAAPANAAAIKSFASPAIGGGRASPPNGRSDSIDADSGGTGSATPAGTHTPPRIGTPNGMNTPTAASRAAADLIDQDLLDLVDKDLKNIDLNDKRDLFGGSDGFKLTIGGPPPSTSIAAALAAPIARVAKDPLLAAQEKAIEVEREAALAKQKEEEERKKILFPFDNKFNEKLILWNGDICSLETDAIVNTTNERLNDHTGVSGRIFQICGSELVNDCIRAEGCPTGDAIITKAYNLPSSYIIHTVGPRFSLKYQTAAENALHGCYRRSLELLKDSHLSSIAFSVINTERKGYPRVSAAHIAFRTVRRFLEWYGDGVGTVVLCVNNTSDWKIYETVLPLYFPRSVIEQSAAQSLLPKDTGNSLGETVIEERKIRIGTMPGGGGFIQMPKPTDADAKELNAKSAVDDRPLASGTAASGTAAGSGTAAAGSSSGGSSGGEQATRQANAKVGGTGVDTGFAQMQDNPDEVRRLAEAAKPAALRAKEEEERVYANYLRRAKEEDLKDMQDMNFIYYSGTDSMGRPVAVIVAQNFPATHKNMDRVLLYLIKVLDPIVQHDYNIVYFHTNIADSNKPAFEWLRKIYGIFNRKYKKNMKRLFVVHPTVWVRLAIWFASPFVKKKFWKKMKYVYKLRELYDYFDAQKLQVPEAVVKTDHAANAAFYKATQNKSTADSTDENDKL